MKLTIEEMHQYETEILKEVVEICERNKVDYFLAYGSVIGAVRHGGPIPWDSDVDIVVPYNQFDNFVKVIRKELSDKFYVDYYDTNKHYPFLFPRLGLKNHSTNLLHLDVFKLIGVPANQKEREQFNKKILSYNDIYRKKKMSGKYGKVYSWKGKLYSLFLRTIHIVFSEKRLLKKFETACVQYPYDQSSYVLNANGGYGEKEMIPKSYYGKGTDFNYSDIKLKIPESHHEYLSHFYGDYMKPPPEDERKTKPFYVIIKL